MTHTRRESVISARKMSCKSALPEEDLMCPVCRDIFRDPVVLACSHSICKACLREFWNTKGTQECPLCRKLSPNAEPPRNLALRNLCEAVLRQKKGLSQGDQFQTCSARPPGICTAHGEQFKLFCLEDREPLCVVCRDSRLHKHHECQPLDEAALDLKVSGKRNVMSIDIKY